MKHILIAIFYYPIIATIGLVIEIFITLCYLLDFLWHFKSDDILLDVIKKYFKLYRFSTYKESIIKGKL